MDAKKYISVEDFNEYTKIIKNEFENLKTSVQESSSNKEDKSLNEGLVKYAESIAKKVNFDVEYLKKKSFIFDLKILYLTFIKIIRRESIKH